MAVGDVYTKVINRDDDGAVLRMELWRKGTRTWPDKRCGIVYYSENDGLCDVYGVVLDGHQIGLIEDYGNRILICPDYDTAYTREFDVIAKGLM